jgi:glutaredoxin
LESRNRRAQRGIEHGRAGGEADLEVAMAEMDKAAINRITFYTKLGCPLCDDAKATLRALCDELSLELLEIDITTDPILYEAFHEEIPVAYLDGRKLFKYRVDPALLRRQLQRRRRWLSSLWFSPWKS